MKNLLSILLGLFVVLLNAGNLKAGDDKKAKAILDELSKNTRSYSSITSDYTRIVVNKDKKQVENQKGKIKVKGKKFRMELAGLLIITDGSTMWTQNEGELSIKDYEKDSELNPDNIFFMYEKGYDYVLEKTIKEGKNTVYVINLTPQKKKKVDNVKLYVDGSKKKIMKAEIYRTNKSVEIIEINNFTPNTSIADTDFKVDVSKFPPDQVMDERSGN
jgi:outer membrane lipoprotein carrier protein